VGRAYDVWEWWAAVYRHAKDGTAVVLNHCSPVLLEELMCLWF